MEVVKKNEQDREIIRDKVKICLALVSVLL